MLQVTLEEFGESIVLDNALLAHTVAAGEPVPLADVLDLAAGVRALYNTATMLSRDFDYIADCWRLWSEVSRTLEELESAWQGVPASGELISWHRTQLERLRWLALDRIELYSTKGADRRRYLAHKAADA